MQKATVWSLGWVITVLSYGRTSRLLKLMLDGRLKPVLAHYATPLAHMNDQAKQLDFIQFPPFVLQDYEYGIRTGNFEAREVKKMVNFQLGKWAPDVHFFLQNAALQRCNFPLKSRGSLELRSGFRAFSQAVRGNRGP